jgi:hypothetical protein
MMPAEYIHHVAPLPEGIKPLTARYISGIIMRQYQFSMVTVSVLIMMLLLFAIPSRSAHAFSDFFEWGISKEEMIRRYASQKHRVLTPASDPAYKNKIMNYIIAIDQDLKPKIAIIRSSNGIVRDFLLIDNTLYSVLERHGIITPEKRDEIVRMLTAKFGSPSIQRDKKITIYSFRGEKTKALLIFHDRSSDTQCTIYFYARNLFKMLISR